MKMHAFKHSISGGYIVCNRSNDRTVLQQYTHTIIVANVTCGNCLRILGVKK